MILFGYQDGRRSYCTIECVNMYDCPNCGMMPFACVCVPWCDDHGGPREICACPEKRYEPNVPFVVMAVVVLATIAWGVFYFS